MVFVLVYKMECAYAAPRIPSSLYTEYYSLEQDVSEEVSISSNAFPPQWPVSEFDTSPSPAIPVVVPITYLLSSNAPTDIASNQIPTTPRITLSACDIFCCIVDHVGDCTRVVDLSAPFTHRSVSHSFHVTVPILYSGHVAWPARNAVIVLPGMGNLMIGRRSPRVLRYTCAISPTEWMLGPPMGSVRPLAVSVARSTMTSATSPTSTGWICSSVGSGHSGNFATEPSISAMNE